jgi:hypothetical protein
MKAATVVKRGDPEIKETVNNARDEMNRFTAYYRRNNKVAGAASFSTLYTAISTLSGHFQNYGPEYPVPAKRQKVRTNRLCIRTGTQLQHTHTHTHQDMPPHATKRALNAFGTRRLCYITPTRHIP